MNNPTERKAYIITGPASGAGRATALEMAKHSTLVLGPGQRQAQRPRCTLPTPRSPSPCDVNPAMAVTIQQQALSTFAAEIECRLSLPASNYSEFARKAPQRRPRCRRHGIVVLPLASGVRGYVLTQ